VRDTPAQLNGSGDILRKSPLSLCDAARGKTMKPWAAYALASAFFAGITAILAKQGVSGIDSNLATALRTAVVLVFACAIVAARGVWRELPQIEARTAWFLVLSGLATGASWLCYFHALKLGPASRVAPLDKLSVIFVLLFSAMFLGEPLTLRSVGGALLIVGGALLLLK
jgi:transporter family protein